PSTTSTSRSSSVRCCVAVPLSMLVTPICCQVLLLTFLRLARSTLVCRQRARNQLSCVLRLWVLPRLPWLPSLGCLRRPSRRPPACLPMPLSTSAPISSSV